MFDNKTAQEVNGTPVSTNSDMAKESIHGDGKHSSLESLIANYGDSSNTTWVEDKFEVWRHDKTGAALGYMLSQDYCIIWGNPLCESEYYPEVARDFLKWVEEEGWKPIWACANAHLEKFLANELDWRAVFCVQEDGLDPTKVYFLFTDSYLNPIHLRREF